MNQASTPDAELHPASRGAKGRWAQVLARGQFFTVSMLLHAVLLAIVGTTVLFRSMDDSGKEGFTGESGTFLDQSSAPAESIEEPQQNPLVELVQAEPPVTALTTIGPSLSSIPTLTVPVTVAPSLPSAMGRSGGESAAGLPSLSGGKGQGMAGPGKMATSRFFGLESKGNRVVFVVDYSRSMRGPREDQMRTELTESIQKLEADTEFALIFFSGPVWVAGDDPKDYTGAFSMEKDGWQPSKKSKYTPKPRWMPATEANKKKSIELVKETELSGGTDWRWPLRYALEMQPPPDAIFFMTDGSPQVKNEDDVLAEVRKSLARIKPPPTITTIALGEPKAEESMKELAKMGNGKFRLVEVGKTPKKKK